MKLLFCVQASALHAARWINQFADTGWDIHVLENLAPGHGICPELACGHAHVPFPRSVPAGVQASSTLSRSWRVRGWLHVGRAPSTAQVQRAHVDYWTNLIRTLRPDVIHLLGMGVNWTNQSATLMAVRDRLGGRLPCPLIYSSWGTDLEIFAAEPANRPAAVRFLGSADHLIAECDRDHRLACEMGFRGGFLGKLPAFGGTDLKAVEPYRQAGRPSARRVIVLKGRDYRAPGGDPVGRALTALRAIERCADVLQPYRVVVLHADKLVTAEAATVSALTGVDIHIMSRLPYEDIMRIMGAARVMMAMTVNDGLPSILVEAMALGALPLHSDLEPIREWVTDGVNGLLVPPEDVEATAVALRRAVTDDALVDRASEANSEIIRTRLGYATVRQQAIGMYERVVSG